MGNLGVLIDFYGLGRRLVLRTLSKVLWHSWGIKELNGSEDGFCSFSDDVVSLGSSHWKKPSGSFMDRIWLEEEHIIDWRRVQGVLSLTVTDRTLKPLTLRNPWWVHRRNILWSSQWDILFSLSIFWNMGLSRSALPDYEGLLGYGKNTYFLGSGHRNIFMVVPRDFDA